MFPQYDEGCDNDISLHRSYSAISDTNLDQLIRNIRSHFPRIGCRQMRAMLEADHGLRIQRCRVGMAMRRVDPAGAAILTLVRSTCEKAI